MLSLSCFQNLTLPNPTLPPSHSAGVGYGCLSTTTLHTTRPTTPTRPLPCPLQSSASRNRTPAHYETSQPFNWNDLFKKISDPETGAGDAAHLLNQLDNRAKPFLKWELCKVVRQLRKFRKFNSALQVYQWMNDRRERFELFSSDMAVQLDLISKVHGISSAEDFFIQIPELQKDNRVYGALLNAYVGAKVRDKAELLMETMRGKGYLSETLPYNVMMTLYMKLKEYEKVDLIVSELKHKDLPLDLYSYNIWLSARGSRDDVDGVGKVFEEMKRSETIKPNWSTFATLATLYIRLGQVEKAHDFLKGLESHIVGRNRLPYHYLINMYGSVGNKKEVHRVWSVYKSSFYTIPNWGYHAIISSLVKVGDPEGAEKMYDEWLSVKTVHDTRIPNILLTWYVKEGRYEKAESFFGRIGETGGKPTATSWEILAACHIKQRRIPEALNCFGQAVSAEGSDTWKPRPANVSSFLQLCEQEADQTSKEDIVALLRQLGCSDEIYRSIISEYIGTNVAGTEQLMGDYRSDLVDENVETDNEGSEMLFSLAE